MPPKRKISTQARAALHTARAQALHHQAEMEDIIGTLKAKPHLVPLVTRYMVEIGALEGSTAHPAPSALAPPEEVELAGTTPDKKCQLGDGGCQEGPSEGVVVGSSYYTLGGLPVKELTNICSSLEPLSLSKFQLKALICRGQRQISKNALLELIEFMTGVDGSFSLTGEFRKWNVIMQALADKNQERNRPAKDLMLPADWAQHGVYHYDPKTQHLTNKISQNTVDLSNSSILLKATGALYLENNFSEARANLVEPGQGCVSKLVCCACFVQQGVFKVSGGDREAETPAKKLKKGPPSLGTLAPQPAASSGQQACQTPEGKIQEESSSLAPAVPPSLLDN
jgi:hypothetical protein